MNGGPMRTIVTGSQGFIGRALTARLRRDGWDVTEWSADVRTIARLTANTDVVFHLAAATRAEQFAAAAHAAYEINVAGTLAVLQYCQRTGARCVMASTSGVYDAARLGRPLSEEAPIHPLTPYSISKWLAECMCRQQAEAFGVSSVILRLFNVYGPGQHSSFLIPYVIGCLLRHEPLRMRMPDAVRDFVYIDDVVEAFVNVSRLAESMGSVFNIGSGQPTRIRDVVQCAEAVVGSSCGMETSGPHAGEPSVVVADIARARTQLQWSPTHDLSSGLRTTCQHAEAVV